MPSSPVYAAGFFKTVLSLVVFNCEVIPTAKEVLAISIVFNLASFGLGLLQPF